jgi:Protein of unknown function (DUF4238)
VLPSWQHKEIDGLFPFHRNGSNIMENNPSRKHHYLPRHYLEGFTNNDGGLHVYDKKADTFFLSGPGAVFYENDLNTITNQNGESSTFLETLYTDIENRSWNSFDNIRNSTPTAPNSVNDMMHLYHFLLVLHWRLPTNVIFVEKLSDKFFHGNNELDYFKLKNKTGIEVPENVKESITNSSAFKKASKLILSFAPFFKVKNWGNFDNWRFLYFDKALNGAIVGDNPIITTGNYDHDPINCLNEFLFPVSRHILLINKDKPPSADLPVEFTIQFNTAILERSKRFVASHNKAFLERIVDYYKSLLMNGKSKCIVEQTFSFLG